MKKLVFAFLPALLLSTTLSTAAASAQGVMEMPVAEITMKLTLTPFNLAYLAFNGYFEGQSIPSYDSLMRDFRAGKITGSQVVQAAIKQKRLPASFLTNDAYINAVSSQLYALSLSN